jgi:hypothetical protein
MVMCSNFWKRFRFVYIGLRKRKPPYMQWFLSTQTACSKQECNKHPLFHNTLCKIYSCILCICIGTINTYAQGNETENKQEQAFENLADNTETENNEDDNYLQFLEAHKRFKLDVNKASVQDLKEFYFISDVQSASFINYRKQLGNFISIYELQAIPFWDAETVRRILPFVTASGNVNIKETLRERLTGGNHQILTRFTRVLELSKGFTDKPPAATNYYLGDPERWFFRYKYQFKNKLQYGLVGEKDAGEVFGFKNNTYGFDHYSYHFMVRDLNKVDFIMLGDFTVNYGQGLTSYQGLAFRKSGDALAIKRQASPIRPYLSQGEFNFQRGAAIGFKFNNITTHVFAAHKKQDANVVVDTIINEDFFSSIQTSGLHRTNAELLDKNSIQRTSFGGQVKYANTKLQVSLQGIQYVFNKPWQKATSTYNEYAITGSNWGNYSAEYGYNINGLHLFGEVATDYKNNVALVQGALLSIDKHIDVSLLYRNIDKAYQSVQGNAFTESTLPNNEKGLYTGMVVRPLANVRIDAYADFYKFPFFKYQTNAPTNGNDYMVQLLWRYKKLGDIYIRYRTEQKPRNITSDVAPIYEVAAVKRDNIRLQVNYKLSDKVSMRFRTDGLYFKQGNVKETGALYFADVFYKPMLSPLTFSTRLQYHETDSYNSRIYAYENDVLYSFSIPAFFGKGARYYVNANYDWRINRLQTLSFWLRLAQTFYGDTNVIGSGLDEIKGNKRTELKLQVLWSIK